MKELTRAEKFAAAQDARISRERYALMSKRTKECYPGGMLKYIKAQSEAKKAKEAAKWTRKDTYNAVAVVAWLVLTVVMYNMTGMTVYDY